MATSQPPFLPTSTHRVSCLSSNISKLHSSLGFYSALLSWATLNPLATVLHFAASFFFRPTLRQYKLLRHVSLVPISLSLSMVTSRLKQFHIHLCWWLSAMYLWLPVIPWIADLYFPLPETSLPRYFTIPQAQHVKNEFMFPTGVIHVFPVSVKATTSHSAAQTNSHLWLFFLVTNDTVTKFNYVPSVFSHLFHLFISRPKCPTLCFHCLLLNHKILLAYPRASSPAFLWSISPCRH